MFKWLQIQIFDSEKTFRPLEIMVLWTCTCCAYSNKRVLASSWNKCENHIIIIIMIISLILYINYKNNEIKVSHITTPFPQYKWKFFNVLSYCLLLLSYFQKVSQTKLSNSSKIIKYKFNLKMRAVPSMCWKSGERTNQETWLWKLTVKITTTSKTIIREKWKKVTVMTILQINIISFWRHWLLWWRFWGQETQEKRWIDEKISYS